MQAHESDVQPPSAPSLGGDCNELAVLTRHLEARLASIDSKLNRLLHEAVKTNSASAIGADRADSNEGRQAADLLCEPGSNWSSPIVGKGWLAVTASGGCSPRWSEVTDLTNHKPRDPYESEQNIPIPTLTSGDNFDVVPEEVEPDEVEQGMCNKSSALSWLPTKLSKLSGQLVLPSKSRHSEISAHPQVSERVIQFLSSKRHNRWLERVWFFFEDPDASRIGYVYERFMRLVIVSSVITTLLQTLPTPPMKQTVSSIVESTFEVYFLLEVFVRFISYPNYKMFWWNCYNWIDLVSGAFFILRASLDFVIPSPIDCHLRCSLLVGFCPVVRSLKMLRRMRQFHLLYKAFVTSYQALQPLLSIYCFLLLVFTGVVWVVEPRSNLANFPAAAWLIFVSMTTVGYGDVTPDTAGGAVIVSISVVMAMLYMAIPVGIIGNAFNDVWKDRDRLLLIDRTRERLQGAGYKASELPDVFQIFDSDKNGQLDSAEFCWMLQGLKLGLTQERRKELFKAFDDDANGGVSHKEFVKALFPESLEDIYGKQGLRGSDMSHADSMSSALNSKGVPHYVIQSLKKKKINSHKEEGGRQSTSE